MSDASMSRPARTLRARRTRRASVRNLPLLLLAQLPMLLWVFDGSLITFFTALFQFSILAAATLLIAQGQMLHDQYDEARTAKAPLLPRKLLGSLIIGGLVYLLTLTRFDEALLAVGLGCAGAVLSIVAFGPDPLRSKGFDDPAYVTERRVISLLTRADASLRDVVERVAQFDDPPIVARTEAVHGAIMRLLRSLANEPLRLIELERPLLRFVALVENEAARLETGLADDRDAAAGLYAARLDALCTAFESGARQRRQTGTPEAYALDTDQLVERISREAAA